MRKMFKTVLATVLVLLFLLLPQAVCAENNDGPDAPAKRTILLYVCGTNLETNNAMATYNLRQILQAKFSEDDDINVIVMTGGANRWHLESKYLAFPEDVTVPEDAVANDDGQSVDPTSQISNIYNQIWEARGADAKIDGEADPNAGKLVLLDGDGITDTKSKKSEEEPVIDPATLKTFINYGVTNYPADKYDLILWDHGGGSTGGYGGDDHVMFQTMPVSGIMDALQDNKMTNRADEDPANDANFDFIDFDACLMSTIELQLVMADYTDYYIASAETEPGYGQYYTGWLNTLGANPETNAFDLGKQMVDEYIDFYENGPGKGEAGTLAVVDSRKFLDSGITAPLSQMTSLLSDQAKAGLFYDEILSSKEAIGYEYMNFFDLGNFASLVSIASSEQEDGEINPDNAYAAAAITQKICSVLQDPKVIYAGGTKGMQSTSQIYRDSDGAIQGGNQPTSGVSFYFIDAGNQNSIESYFVYYDEMGKVAEILPIKDDGRYEFLNAYRNALMDYALLTVTGNAVNQIVGRGTDKSTINYDTVKDYLGGNETDPVVSKYTEWSRVMLRLLEKCGDDAAKGEAAKKEWLNNTIRQQADEAVDAENITASKVKQKNGTGYKVHISETRNRVIDQVERKISLEIPVTKSYIEKKELYVEGQLPFGSVRGTLDISSALSPDVDVSDIIDWYTGTESDWILDAPEEKWYAIKDADGKLHAAAIVAEDKTSFTVAAKIEDGDEDEKNDRHMLLKFSKGYVENVLTEITDVTDSEGNRPVKPAELTQPISLMPSLRVSGRIAGAMVQFYVPTSETEFALSSTNADQISLVYTDISKITDIGDTDEDGTALNSQFSIRDIYGGVTNITDVVNKAEEELIDIELAEVSSAVYTGKTLTPEVTCQGETLQDGTDYTWDLISAGDEDLTKAGDYNLLLTGKGRFTGVELKTFKIAPADISSCKASMKTSLTYTGKALKPAVKVSGIPASAYKASYFGNTKVGTGKVTITAADPNYKGTITKTFKILPKKARIAKVKTGKKKLTVKAKVKVGKTGGTRYQIQYRAKGVSKWKTRTTKKPTLTIKKLKKGKKYQVRIRAFKKAGGKTYYGAWSQTSTSRKVK